MLTGKMVRVRYARDRILPYYLNTDDENWRLVAEAMLELFRELVGHTRGELEAEIEATFGDDPGQLVHQGLAKLLEDRCEFEVVSGQPPDKLRQAAFRAATEHRKAGHPGFDRAAVLQQAAAELALSTEEVEQSLFADLK